MRRIVRQTFKDHTAVASQDTMTPFSIDAGEMKKTAKSPPPSPTQSGSSN